MCRNSIVDKLIEECTKVIDEHKFYNETLNTIPSDDCASCFFYNKKTNTQLNPEKNTVPVKFNPHTQTTIY